MATLLYYLGRDFTVADPSGNARGDDPRFIPGRQALVLYKGKVIGVYGEVHPRVLEAWGITTPCAAGELDLDALIG